MGCSQESCHPRGKVECKPGSIVNCHRDWPTGQKLRRKAESQWPVGVQGLAVQPSRKHIIPKLLENLRPGTWFFLVWGWRGRALCVGPQCWQLSRWIWQALVHLPLAFSSLPLWVPYLLLETHYLLVCYKWYFEKLWGQLGHIWICLMKSNLNHFYNKTE